MRYPFLVTLGTPKRENPKVKRYGVRESPHPELRLLDDAVSIVYCNCNRGPSYEDIDAKGKSGRRSGREPDQGVDLLAPWSP